MFRIFINFRVLLAIINIRLYVCLFILFVDVFIVKVFFREE